VYAFAYRAAGYRARSRPAAAVRRGGSDGSALSAKFTKSKIPRGIGHAYRRCEIYLLRSTCDDVSTFNPEPVARHRAAARPSIHEHVQLKEHVL
jgi:hypothetical protein